MSDDLVATYSERRRQFLSAKKDADKTIEYLRRKIGILSTWQQVSITGSQTDCVPKGAQTQDEKTIRLGEWPSGEKLAEVLGKAHETHLAMTKAFGNVPEPIRECLQEPPSL